MVRLRAATIDGLAFVNPSTYYSRNERAVCSAPSSARAAASCHSSAPGSKGTAAATWSNCRLFMEFAINPAMSWPVYQGTLVGRDGKPNGHYRWHLVVVYKATGTANLTVAYCDHERSLTSIGSRANSMRSATIVIDQTPATNPLNRSIIKELGRTTLRA